ncbi:MAG: hypothetical protein Q4A28_00415 [Brachymonas sp.]|nr:hypothetical protein [Brachymonas sp.]
MALRTSHWQEKHWQKHIGYALRALWLGLPCWALAQAQAVEHKHARIVAPQAALHAAAPTGHASLAAPAASESAATTMKPPAVSPTVVAASATASSATPACFDEAQWRALQRSTAHANGLGQGVADKVLLYVWSPRMVFSAVHAHQVQQEAQALGLRFVPVHDGRLPAEEVAQALAVLPQKLQKPQHLVPGSAVPQSYSHPLQTSVPLCAPSLVARDAYRHFPTAWVVQHGSFHPVPLVSAMPPRFWRMGLLERLQPQQELQQSQSLPDAAQQ